MNATSLRADSKLAAEVVAIAEAIIVKAKECAAIDGCDAIGDNSVFTFVSAVDGIEVIDRDAAVWVPIFGTEPDSFATEAGRQVLGLAKEIMRA